jgi:hypothetical protein
MSRASSLRKARRNVTESAHIPAPVGGLNTIDPGYQMPDLDCPLLYNMIPAENGLRSRLGYKEWCTGVGSSTVPTIMPFAGSSTNGSKDKLFATSTGTAKIYDVSASSAAPTAVLNLASSAGDAGWGVPCGVVSASGQHFLLYCDEQNGYHVYSETNDSWVVPTQQTSLEWTGGTVYGAGARVRNKGITYKTTAGGTAAATGGPTGVGTGIVDNTVTWDYEATVGGVNPANLVFATIWKNFVLLVEKDSSRMWFGTLTNQLYGTLTSFDFGAKFRHGGNLVGLWSWTGDGGIGIDDYLVAIGSGGDVVIYQGTDPNSANTFAIRGVWFVGGVPAGRRVATDFGGDLLILSNRGVVSISTLTGGADNSDTTQYATRKIGNTFARGVATYGSTKGWSLRIHPEDSSLMITVPTSDDGTPVQFAMSLLTRGWAQYRSLPIISAEAWGRKLYFGTSDGRVCQNTGYLDNVDRATTTWTAIQCSGITAFRNLGNGGQKQLQMVRPTIISEGGSVPYSVQAKYRYDLNELSQPSANPANASNVWDTAVWDTALWGGAYQTQQAPSGATGMGPDVAIAFRMAVNSRTVLTGFDVLFTQGSFL